MALKILIVEDEVNGQITLKNIIMQFSSEQHEVAIADGVQDALRVTATFRPDLVFLDVHLSDGTGFNYLEKLDAIPFNLVFVTAFDHYAQRAIKFAALDYILKPFEPDEIVSSIEKAEQHLADKNLKEKIDFLFQQQEKNDKIILPTQDGFEIYSLEDIAYVMSENNYSIFKTRNGKELIVTKTLKYFENLLTNSSFIRTHQRYLVNVNFITKYIKGEGGFVIVLDQELPVSRRKKEALLTALSNKFLQ
ncbi:LytR/AlgR family response regulator transcription factor [Parvicella tangerina]|uniref:Transcriptional regulatory protein BtsR n=1 Tax=Parvicella tangerina TaxID=2829795 RepID=A0A916JKK4_9FLAO|nr:LytTR family DNA-binding domain-containing protein [Parvicella tangerina]CAG5077068.1 Transcriptional regulatory protein BtsR [Parvicella tangerina]